MLLGLTITPGMLVGGGASIFLLMVFQVLQGLRKIKFKGALHLKVHKATAYLIVVMMIIHALFALAHFSII